MKNKALKSVWFLKPLITVITVIFASSLYEILYPFNVFAVWFALAMGYSINNPWLILTILCVVFISWLIAPILIYFNKTFKVSKIVLYSLLFLELISIILSMCLSGFSVAKTIAILFNIGLIVLLKHTK